VTCFSPSLRACEAIQVQEVMFIFELFRVIALPIDYQTNIKQMSSGNAILLRLNKIENGEDDG